MLTDWPPAATSTNMSRLPGCSKGQPGQISGVRDCMKVTGRGGQIFSSFFTTAKIAQPHCIINILFESLQKIINE